MRNKFSEKATSINDTVSQKFPKVHSATGSAFTYLKDIWQETFPNEEKKSISKIERRREAAKLQKEMDESQEHIENIQQQIPEWKRNAVTVTDQQAQEEKKGIFSRLAKGVKSKISETEAAKQFFDSEEYKKIDKLRSEMNEFKSNLKEEIDSTQNPFVRGTREVADVIFLESNCARAIKEMEKYDPDFDI